jgi:ribosomal protein L34E
MQMKSDSEIRSKYRMLSRPDCPIAPPSGIIAAHRWILYNNLGRGAHPCHWCGKRLFWQPKDRNRQIHADHVNGRTLDNRPENIVASCRRCNTIRDRNDRIAEHEPVFVNCYGNRTRVTAHQCAECGSEFLAVPSARRTFCSRHCSQSAHNRDRGEAVEGGFYIQEGTKKRLVVRHVCAGCGQTFVGRPNRKFCSMGCSHQPAPNP